MKYKNPVYIQALSDDVAFYRGALGTSLGLVFDIGANHGDKAWVFRQMAARVVCVEPDEHCFSALRTRYGREKRVSLENIALGDQVGQGRFYIDGDGSAYNTLSEKQRLWLVSKRNRERLRECIVPISTLDRLIAKYGIPDFIKIDVEGYELPVLNGLHYKIPILSFEANLPNFRRETLDIIKRARDGYSQFNLRLGNGFVFPTHQDSDRVEEVLSRNEEITYDVFIYNGLCEQSEK